MRQLLTVFLGLALVASLQAEADLRQTTCGSATPVNVASGTAQMISTPGFPMPYSVGQSCSWNFVTTAPSVFKITCLLVVPCTDTVFALGNGYCGTGVLSLTSANASASISTVSAGGQGFMACFVAAVSSSTVTFAPATKPTTPRPTTRPTTPLVTTKPATPAPTTRPTTPPLTTKPTTPRPLTDAPTTRPPSTPAPTTRPPSTAAPTTRPPSTPAPTTRPPSNTTASPTCNCGVLGANRIVGGSPAGQNEYPWMVMLLNNGYGPFCGGSIIAPGWILTAAHCTVDFTSAASLGAVAGRYAVSTPSATQQFRDAIAIYNHPAYDPNTQDNDLALIKLSTPFTFSSAVSPICLPSNFATYDFSGQSGIGTGWGTTSSGGSTSDILLEVSMPILTTDQCRQYPLMTNSLTNNMFCTYQAGKDTCQGDSGGPLNWIDPATGRAFLAGLTSWGYGCADVGAPGVYTKVNNYLSWIQQTTGLTFCNP